MEKKLKLTKLTVADLQHIKAGIDECACEVGAGNGAWNRDHPWVSVIVCIFP